MAEYYSSLKKVTTTTANTVPTFITSADTGNSTWTVSYATPTLIAALYKRGIGFKDQLAFFDELLKNNPPSKFPPYDILSIDEDSYEIRFAVAGFSKSDIEITLDKNTLIVKGNKDKEEDLESYFHKGIAERSFTQSFPLVDYVDVVGAELKDGILTIKLERNLPEEMKPKSIKIK